MSRRRGILAGLILLLAQASPASLLVAPAQGQDIETALWGAHDDCSPVPKFSTWAPLTFNPPPDWQGRVVGMHATILKDGTPQNIRLVRSSGSESLDAAALAHVQKTWRWLPLLCSSRGQDFSLGVPRLGCVAQAWLGSTPLPTVLRKHRGDFVVLDLKVGQDGQVKEAAIARSSGDAGSDAEVQAFVRENWRYYPLGQGCGTAKTRPRIVLASIIARCEPQPLLETQTSPNVRLQESPRATELAINVRWDGSVADASVTHGSGDTGLDAAAVAHVKQTWRWQPFSCTDIDGSTITAVKGAATVHFSYARIEDGPPP